MISTFYGLLSKPMGAIVNTCTSILKNLKSSTPPCVAEYLPNREPKKNLIEVNPQGVFHRTIAEKPKKNMIEVSHKSIFHHTTVEEPKEYQSEQPKTPFLMKLPSQQEQRYNKLRRHFQSDEVDFIYRRAFKSISPRNHSAVKGELSDAGILVQPPTSQFSNADCGLVMHELSESMLLVECPANQSSNTSSDLSDTGILVQSPPRFPRSQPFAMGPISLVRALLSPA